MSTKPLNQDKLADSLRKALNGRIPNAFQGGPIRDDGADPEGLATHPDDLVGLHASTHIMVKDAMTILWARYPGFLWAIQPDERGKILNIFNLNFHDQWGYTIRFADLVNDPKMRAVVKAGSELLRRFHYPANRYVPDLIAALPRDALGRAIPDLSDQKKSRFKTESEIALAVAKGNARTFIDTHGNTILEIKE